MSIRNCVDCKYSNSSRDVYPCSECSSTDCDNYKFEEQEYIECPQCGHLIAVTQS